MDSICCLVALKKNACQFNYIGLSLNITICMTFIGTNIRIKLLNRYCFLGIVAELWLPFFPFFDYSRQTQNLKTFFANKRRVGAMTVRSHPWSSSQRWVSVGIAFLAPLLFVSCLALYLVLVHTPLYILQKSRRDESFLGRGLNNLSLGHSPEHLCGTVRNTELRIVL